MIVIFVYAVLQNGDEITLEVENATVKSNEMGAFVSIHHIAQTAPIVKLSDGDTHTFEYDWCIHYGTRMLSVENVIEANCFVKFSTNLF